MVAMLRRDGGANPRFRRHSQTRLEGQPQTGAAVDSPDVDRGDLLEAKYQPPPGPSCLSLLFAEFGN
jgi:hypothetical protein